MVPGNIGFASCLCGVAGRRLCGVLKKF